MTQQTTIVSRSQYESLEPDDYPQVDFLVIEDKQPPEMLELIRCSKKISFMSWLDEPCSDLGLVTPRDAAADSLEGLAAVESLIAEMEQWDAQVPEEQRFDFTCLRREVGQTPPQPGTVRLR